MDVSAFLDGFAVEAVNWLILGFALVLSNVVDPNRRAECSLDTSLTSIKSSNDSRCNICCFLCSQVDVCFLKSLFLIF